MLKIGDFSKLSRVSVRMLRYYDEIGLLKPAEIDRFTDYRYYSEAQLPTVCRITALRDMGFGLADVCAILPIYDDRERLDDFLAARQAELEQQRDDVAQRLRLLDTARKRLRKEETMNYDVTIKTLPERYAATVRMTIPRYQDEGMVWQALCRETDSMHLLPTDPCYCCVVFLDGEYKEKDVTVEAQKTVKGPYPDTEQYNMGIICLYGFGVEKNLETAREWLEKAASQDHAQAKAALKALPDAGTGKDTPS